MSDNTSDEASHTENDSSDEEPVEWLAEGRERRSTAGNRLSTLLDQEGPDEDLDLLFAEGEDEDVEFDEDKSDEEAEEEEGGGSSSSSEGDDDNEADELAGEKQLQSEERAAKRAQKRKTDQTLVRPSTTKRVKIDPRARAANVKTPAKPRPKKKSERVSWAFSDTEGQTRASSRTLSVQNKERTRASLKANEVKRKRQLATMEAAQKKKDASVNRSMTQEERLEEAARVEEANSKALSRWEQTERERLEKQQRRLEALQDRHLEGPVIRFWSGMARWRGEELLSVGKKLKVEEVVEPENDDLDEPGQDSELKIGQNGEEQPGGALEKDPGADLGQEVEKQSTNKVERGSEAEADRPVPEITNEPTQMPLPQTAEQADTSTNLESAVENHPADGDRSRASDGPAVPELITHDTKPKLDTTAADTTETSLSKSPTSTSPSHPPLVLSQSQNQDSEVQKADEPSEQVAHDTPFAATGAEVQAHSVAGQSSIEAELPTATETVPQAPQTPLEIEVATRNTLTLLNFDSTAIRSLEVQKRILCGWKTVAASRPVKPVQLTCAITNTPARFRDPLTGLGYRSAAEFKRVRSLMGEGNGVRVPVWSALLGAWIDPADESTLGLPDTSQTSPEKETGSLNRSVDPSVKVEGTRTATPAT